MSDDMPWDKDVGKDLKIGKIDFTKMSNEQLEHFKNESEKLNIGHATVDEDERNGAD